MSLSPEEKRAIKCAINELIIGRQRYAIDANLHNQIGVDNPRCVFAAKEHERMTKAIEVLRKMLEKKFEQEGMWS